MCTVVTTITVTSPPPPAVTTIIVMTTGIRATTNATSGTAATITSTAMIFMIPMREVPTGWATCLNMYRHISRITLIPASRNTDTINTAMRSRRVRIFLLHMGIRQGTPILSEARSAFGRDTMAAQVAIQIRVNQYTTRGQDAGTNCCRSQSLFGCRLSRVRSPFLLGPDRLLRFLGGRKVNAAYAGVL